MVYVKGARAGSRTRKFMEHDCLRAHLQGQSNVIVAMQNPNKREMTFRGKETEQTGRGQISANPPLS